MTDAILIFTFSPIQSFISEARRAADLYAGSKILSRLANAAALELQGENRKLIYPAQPKSNDTPNKLVAIVPFEQAEEIAREASNALLKEWRDIAEAAREELSKYGPAPDTMWNEIWKRQRDSYWEIYWVAQKMIGGYGATFKQASSALDAVKRTRSFKNTDEAGMKDTLSGRRSALLVEKMAARAYWSAVRNSKNFENPALLRPDGKERLDTLGAVKRFCELKDDDKKKKFLSVSSVATADFLNKAQENAREQLRAHRDAVKGWAYRVRDDTDWPFDGDLFFVDTLTKARVKDSYDMPVSETNLESARRTLAELTKKVGMKPSLYYAILQLDGDSMGEMISECKSSVEHRAFSEQLAKFAEQVIGIVVNHHGQLIYNGGDDVLALAPLNKAIPLARELARVFHEIVEHPNHPKTQDKNCTMSAGIAIAHHLSPLDAALNAARSAERRAKEVDGKNAVCVRVLKRSGETFDVRSKWNDIEKMQEVVALFQADLIASKLAYDVLRDATVVTALSEDARQATLRRLIKRHKTDKFTAMDDLAESLQKWAAALDGQLPKSEMSAPCDSNSQEKKEIPQGYAELGKWLVTGRFIAQGGGE